MLNKLLTSIQIITIMKACSTTKGGSVKTAELRRMLKEGGATFYRRGSNHDIWQCHGFKAPVPRHRTIDEYTARGILKQLHIVP